MCATPIHSYGKKNYSSLPNLLFIIITKYAIHIIHNYGKIKEL